VASWSIEEVAAFQAAVTAQKLYLWLAIQIDMDQIADPPESYLMKDGIDLPKDGLPLAAIGKTCFKEICHFVYISPSNSPTENAEG
jgi:hypothetical protein